MRALFAATAASLLVLAGCSSGPSPEPVPAPSPTSVAPAEPTETPIALGIPFTIAGPNYTANITIERVYLPELCDDTTNQYPAIEADVEVTTGDGTREVLNGGTIRERTPDGYIQKDRTVTRSCNGINELNATNVQSGDNYKGVRWLQNDVNPESEILINTPSGGGPITEVFVLDLGEIDMRESSEPAPATPAAAPAPAVQQAPTSAAVPVETEPYVVECLFGTPGPSRMSDGTIQSTDYCANQPGAAESRYFESNCSDLAWRQNMGLEGDNLCGSTAFQDGAFGGN